MVVDRQSAPLKGITRADGRLTLHRIGPEHLERALKHRSDRMLLGVAQAEDLILLTADAALIDLAGRDPRLPLRGV